MEVCGRKVHVKIADMDRRAESVDAMSRWWLAKLIGETDAEYRRHAERIMKQKHGADAGDKEGLV